MSICQPANTRNACSAWIPAAHDRQFTVASSRNIETVYRLTPLQQGILYHSLEQADPELYTGQYTCEICGTLDSARLHRAWQTLTAQHAALRTLFAWRRQETPVQIVRKQVEIPWSFADWRENAPAQTGELWQQFADQERSRGFKLDSAPLIRPALVRVADTRYRFSLCYHHIVLDGWSLRLLLDQAARLYHGNERGAHASSAGSSSPLPFSEFVDWHYAHDWSKSDAYWAKQLGDIRTPTPLPLAENPVPVSDRGKARSTGLTLEDGLVGRLEAFARDRRVTMNTLFIGAWAILLSRYADESSALFGTTWAGRPDQLAGAQYSVGLFINTLPTRINITDQTVSDWLSAVQQLLVDMREHEQSPLLHAQKASGLPAGQPLFESLIVMQSVPAGETNHGEWSISNETFFEYTNYPLALLVRPGNPFNLLMVHDPRRVCDAEVEQVLSRYLTILENLVLNPEQPVQAIEMFSADERAWLIEAARGDQTDVIGDRTIDALICAAAKREPQQISLRQNGEGFTYQEFEHQAELLAAELRCQTTPGFFGAVFLERSPQAMIAMLGILKAGGTYVPLDPDYPAERTGQVLGDLANAVIVTRQGLAETLPDMALPVVLIDSLSPDGFSPDLNSNSGHSARSPAGYGDCAYVMYTSGSSGQPKGTLVTHTNLIASTTARKHFYRDPPERFLLLSSLATDSSIAGIFWTLSAGGTLVLPQPRKEQSVGELLELIECEHITHMLCLPSLYAILLEHADAAQLSPLRCVIVAGEACSRELVQAHFRLCKADLYNEYGPSEATVWATVAKLEQGMAAIPIGCPIANAMTYVLDSHQRLVPAGVPGELCIAGAGVAAGYLGREELTAEKFIPNPYGDGLLYRTGDRARLQKDGQLYFLGRVDNQFKVRGFRVEPEEIEAALTAIAGITDAAVVLSAADRLTAFITCDGSPPDTEILRETLGNRLPAFMVPQSFISLDKLPRAPGGKVDRAALGERNVTASATTEYRAPGNATEQMLASIWADVLGLSRVGINDDFFALGGDSLLSIRILARAHKGGLQISPEDFFAQPTVAGQAALAAQTGGERTTSKPFSMAKLDAAGLAAVARQLKDADKKN